MEKPELEFSDRTRSLEVWRARLMEAKRQYELAAGDSKAAGRDFTAGTMPSPDGGFNLIHTIRAERRARSEYMRILRIFTDLVIADKVPETAREKGVGQF